MARRRRYGRRIGIRGKAEDRRVREAQVNAWPGHGVSHVACVSYAGDSTALKELIASRRVLSRQLAQRKHIRRSATATSTRRGRPLCGDGSGR